MLLRRPDVVPMWALPASIALVLGVLWMRRRRDDGSAPDEEKSAADAETGERSQRSRKPSANGHCVGINAALVSDSMPCAQAATPGGGPNGSGGQTSPTSPTAAKLGKSAPIDIQPNRLTPVQLTNHQIDRDILNKVPADGASNAAAAAAASDSESGDSPSGLSDSGERRRRFSFGQQRRKRTVQEGNPIVIKATTEAKISPEHSFVEAKYEEAATALAAVEDAAAAAAVAAVEEPIAEAVQVPTTESEVNAEEPAAKSQNATKNKSASKANKNKSVESNNKTSTATPSSSLGSSKDSGQGSASPLTSEDSHAISEAAIAAAAAAVAAGAPATAATVLRHYDFLIVQDLIGTLLGRKGAFVKEIRRCTGTNVVIKKHPQTNVVRIASLEGNSAQIDAALRMIRKKFPLKRHPGLSLNQVHVDDVARLNHSSQLLQLDLIEGINNDVTVSSVVSGGHIFVQQPVHPSFPSLAVLQRCMMRSYQHTEAPEMPASVHGRDAVCAAKFRDHWYRVQIGFEGETTCVVKFLDYGGFATVPRTQLRQIRADFMTVPFQATECVMANVRPLRGAGGREWQAGALLALQKLTENRIVQAQVCGYTVDGLASVHLYSQLTASHVVFLNRELVARGLARWVDDDVEEDDEDDLQEVVQPLQEDPDAQPESQSQLPAQQTQQIELVAA